MRPSLLQSVELLSDIDVLGHFRGDELGEVMIAEAFGAGCREYIPVVCNGGCHQLAAAESCTAGYQMSHSHPDWRLQPASGQAHGAAGDRRGRNETELGRRGVPAHEQHACLCHHTNTDMFLICSLPADERTVPLATVASATKLSEDGVEFLLMKALSLHLIEGSIDQVACTVQVRMSFDKSQQTSNTIHPTCVLMVSSRGLHRPGGRRCAGPGRNCSKLHLCNVFHSIQAAWWPVMFAHTW